MHLLWGVFRIALNYLLIIENVAQAILFAGVGHSSLEEEGGGNMKGDPTYFLSKNFICVCSV
jgi:hypothetical protein